MPRVRVHVLTCLLIGVRWMAHRRVFHGIRRYDTTLLWRSVAYLMLIACVPVPGELLRRHRREPIAVTFLGGTMIATGLLDVAMWRYATAGRRLVDLDPAPVASASRAAWPRC